MPAMGPDTAAQAESVRKIMCIGDITPDYNRCAACTKPNATSRCGKCKVVKYCSRDCQAKHWKSGHKKCCQKAAENCTLRSVLNGGNDWLHITAMNVRQLQRGFGVCNSQIHWQGSSFITSMRCQISEAALSARAAFAC